MKAGKMTFDWDQTGLVCVLLANPHRDPAKRRLPFDMHDFHPDWFGKKRRHRSGRFVLETLASIDGIPIETVTSTTWETPQT